MILRNILFYLGVIPVTIFLASIGWILFFTPFSFRYWLITRWSHFFIFWSKRIIGLQYSVTGAENIPKKNAIVLSNHQSAWETVFYQVLLPTQTWVLKKELLYIPFFGWGLALIEPISINRREFNSVKALIKQGKKRLDAGRWVIIFPEGTRVPVGGHQRFTRSGAALAEASQYPILPIAHNAGLFWPKGFFIKKPGTIQVKIGPLIDPKDKTVAEINDEAEKWIRENTKLLSGY